MEKTHITHVSDGFVFLGHRIIRKRGPRGRMRPVTTIPWEECRGFALRLVKQLSGNYDNNRMDLMESLNRQLRSEEHTSELQSLMRISYAVFCLKKKNKQNIS